GPSYAGYPAPCSCATTAYSTVAPATPAYARSYPRTGYAYAGSYPAYSTGFGYTDDVSYAYSGYEYGYDYPAYRSASVSFGVNEGWRGGSRVYRGDRAISGRFAARDRGINATAISTQRTAARGDLGMQAGRQRGNVRTESSQGSERMFTTPGGAP